MSPRTARSLLGLVCLTLILSLPSWAGLNTWTVDGPDGGRLVSLAVDPRDPAVVYAAGPGAGFWKTLDGGDSWFSIQGDLINTNASAVVLHPNNPDVLLGLTSGGLVRRLNGGPWTLVSSQLEDFSTLHTLHFDRTDASVIYLGSSDDGVLKSSDGGQNWTAVGPENLFNIEFIVQDPVDAGVLYTGGFGGNLFRSSDSGETWTDLGALVGTGRLVDLAVDPLDTQRLWVATTGGLFRSLDGGASWSLQDVGVGLSTATLVRFDPRDPQTLFTGSFDGTGLARSADRGETWALQALDRPASSIEDLVFAGGNILYLGLERGGGVYRSVDDGVTWQWASGGLASTTVTGLAVDPLGGTLLAASEGSGVFRRQGNRWQPLLNSPRNGSCCDDVVAAPGLAQTFYASGSRGVYLSNDDGETWTLRKSGLPTFIPGRNLIIDPSDAQRLYLMTRGGVYRTHDGGLSWTLSTEGFPLDFINDVAVDPKDSQTLYAVTEDRLYRSVDGGVSWQSTTGETPLGFRPNAVAVSPLDSSTLLIGTSFGEALLSVDGGMTWQDAGLSTGSSVWEVEIDETGAALVTTLGGLWRGMLGTSSWSNVGPINALRHPIFASVVEDGPVPTYYVGTQGGSAWSLTEDCLPSDTVLCLDDQPGDRRFAISMDYATSQGGGRSGAAEATGLEGLGIRQGGIFSFFDRRNPEVLVKVLDGCAFNDRYWVFAAATTDVGYTMTVVDTVTNRSRLYSNEDGNVATTLLDSSTFAICPQSLGPNGARPFPPAWAELTGETASLAEATEPPTPAKGISGPCQADTHTLCIDDAPGDQRFAVRLSYATVLGDGASGDALATSLATLGVTDGGILSFFDVTNPEVLIKVINGCDFNGHYWVFYAAATNLGFRVEVEDTVTGFIWDSTNPDGLPALTVTDTSAIATCDG